MMKGIFHNKVSVIGAGNVGATAAMKIAKMDIVRDIVILDIKDGVAEGKAMDINQCAATEDFRSHVVGVTNDYSATDNSDVIVITSGMPRKPGMSREQLVGVNSGIMKDVIENCHKHSPLAIYIIVSNPMDTMCYMAYRILRGLGKKDVEKKVIGMGGLLDSSRFTYFIQEALRDIGSTASASEINAWVVGGHGDTTMIPLINEATYRGDFVTSYFSEDKINEIVDKTMRGGAIVTNLLGTSAWEGAGACIAKTVAAIITNNVMIAPSSVYCKEYDCFIGVFASIGYNGVREVYLPEDHVEFYGDCIDKFKESLAAVKKVNESCPFVD